MLASVFDLVIKWISPFITVSTLPLSKVMFATSKYFLLACIANKTLFGKCCCACFHVRVRWIVLRNAKITRIILVVR